MADEEAEYTPGERSQMWVHEAHVQYIEEVEGIPLARKKPAEVIALAAATRRRFRQDDIYLEAKEAAEQEREEAREAEEAAKAERRAAREAAAKEKAEAKKASKGSGSSKASGGRAKKASGGKASGSGRSRSRSKAKASEEDPFED